MSFQDTQYNLNNSQVILPDIPVSPLDDLSADGGVWKNFILDVVKKDDDEKYKLQFTQRMTFIINYVTDQLQSEFKNIYLNIFIRFQQCQLPARPDGFWKGLFTASWNKLISGFNSAVTAIQGDVEGAFTDAAMATVNTAKGSVEKISSEAEAYYFIRDIHIQFFNVIPEFVSAQTEKDRILTILKTEEMMLKIAMAKQDENIYTSDVALDYAILKKYIGGELFLKSEMENMPETKDYLHAIFGTGFLEDFYNYIKSNFYSK